MRYMMFVAVDPDGEQVDDDTLPAWVADVDGRGKRLIGRAAAAGIRRHHGPGAQG